MFTLAMSLNTSIFKFAYSKEYPFVSSEGHEYMPKYSKNGIVLSSTAAVSRIIGAGVNRDIVRKIEVLQLGKRCDARSSLFGVGYWGWANGGFWVKFPKAKKSFLFGRQEIYFNENALGWNIEKCMNFDPDPNSY